MEEQTKGSSPIMRYWPVLVVALLIGAVVLVGVLGGDDDTDEVAGEDPTTTTADTESDDPDDDPAGTGDGSDAPDCDPETGRIMVPSVYAPDCVPLWPEGADNGGATYQGVTADEIVVVFYDPELAPEVADAQERTGVTTPEEGEQIENRLRLVQTYNDLFETYGRTVRVELVGGSGSGSDESAARADAIRIAEEIGAFAVVGGPTGTNAYADELAERGVLCLCTASQPIDNYLDWSPYVWGGLMASTQGYVHRADFIANRLAGSPAQYAGDEAFQETERTFGLVWYETADGAYQEGISFFEERLAEDGVELTVSLPYIAGGNAQEDAQAIITRLKAEGVTSVIFAGDPFMPQNLTAQATAQDYWPEWIVTGSSGTDSSNLARLYDQDQWANAFGLGFLLPPVDPAVEQAEGNLVSWHLGEELSSYPNITEWGRLFTGIHLAGPDLTPETFRDGLFSFTPVSGFQTHFAVSYGTGLWEWDDYLGADDVTLIYWDPDEPDTRTDTGQVGMYRYLDEARRYLPGEVGRSTTPFFEPEGTVVIFGERPDGDQAPRYPRRSGREG
ncbi:MAG: hypothetical protein ACXIVQ_01220 [Acidimicrobiales bacterium]